MEDRVQELITQLNLQPHPEGGFYSETYRSKSTIPGMDRNFMTSIYFLLVNNHVSHFHKITADECWYYHEGAPLEVHIIHENGQGETLHIGPNLAAGQKPFGMVPGGAIFGSHVQNQQGYTLVSCTVAPGFDFRDFQLFSRAELLEKYPMHSAIICRLTPDV